MMMTGAGGRVGAGDPLCDQDQGGSRPARVSHQTQLGGRAGGGMDAGDHHYKYHRKNLVIIGT